MGTALERAREEIGDVEILDAHAHIGAMDNFHVPGAEASDLVRSMDLLQIATAFVSPIAGMTDGELGVRLTRQAMDAFPGRIAGVPIANPNEPAGIEERLDRWCAALAARMLKIHPTIHEYPVDGPNYRPVFAFAAERGLPVLVHTWDGDPYCDPTRFDRLAAEHPRTTFILGHGGATVPGIRRAVAVAREHPNLYLDCACSLVYDGVVEWMAGELGVSRVLFGTDAVFLDPRPNLGRVLMARLPAADRRRILGENLRAILPGAG